MDSLTAEISRLEVQLQRERALAAREEARTLDEEAVALAEKLDEVIDQLEDVWARFVSKKIEAGRILDRAGLHREAEVARRLTGPKAALAWRLHAFGRMSRVWAYSPGLRDRIANVERKRLEGQVVATPLPEVPEMAPEFAGVSHV